MKILATSDWHFHPYKFGATFEGGMNSRLKDIEDAWGRAVSFGKDQGCQIMTISGDLFHVRGQLKPSVINTVDRCIKMATAAGMVVVIIPGNHDMEDFKGGATAVDFLESFNNVYVLRDQGIILRGVLITGLQYHHSVDEFTREAKKLVGRFEHEAWQKIALIHQGIDEFKIGAMPDTGLTTSVLQGIFGAETPIFCGHYHRPHKEGNIYQVGAPIQHNFGDEGQERGVIVYDLETSYSAFHPLKSKKFITVKGGKIPERWDTGDFIRIKDIDPKAAAKMAKKFAGAGEVTVILEKEYKADESRAVVEPGPVRAMLEQYTAATPEMSPYQKEILSVYDEVCL